MVLREQATQTEQIDGRYSSSFTQITKHTLKFLPSLIIPTMLGVFTVVITVHQQKIAREQRIEDLQLAREQRNEDQQVQSRFTRDRYRDEVLVTYIKEVSDLLERNNGSFTTSPLAATLARIKTLNILRQLDGSRQIYIIRFLYEARQLTDVNGPAALDISTGELTEVDFRTSTSFSRLEKISLAGVHLRNCTFSDISLVHVNFSFARLYNTEFSSARRLFYVNFSSAVLDNVTFSSGWLVGVNFSSARIDDVNFSSGWLDTLNFSTAQLTNVNFSSVRKLENADFTSARFGKNK
jgi:hypothetical protein